MPTTFGDLSRGIKRKEIDEAIARLGRKYLIFSGKGGVGKTTIAVNLAWSLAKAGNRVGLLDIDLHGPDLAAALYLTARLTAGEDGRLLPVEVFPGLWALTAQYLLSSDGEAVIWRGPRKIRAIAQFLEDTAWPKLDYFIIDSPPGTGDETLTIINLIKDLTALVVVTGHPLAIIDVHKGVTCLKQAKAKILGLVENQAGLICPACGETIATYPPENVQNLALKTDLPIIARLPGDPKATLMAESAQRPLVAAAPASLLALALQELAAKL